VRQGNVMSTKSACFYGAYCSDRIQELNLSKSNSLKSYWSYYDELYFEIVLPTLTIASIPVTLQNWGLQNVWTLP